MTIGSSGGARRVLVLGGTGWLGGAIVRHVLDTGAEVVCLARGGAGSVPTGARLIQADRLADGAYAEVGGPWDEVVELSHDPALVAPALDAIAPAAAHWTLVSSVSVYASNDEAGADESAAVVEPEDLTAYADAKVHAERVSTDRQGDRLLVVRPGLIVGPGDPSDRFGYWPGRLARGGPVLAPMVESRSVQVIDVDDLASWIVSAAAARRIGTVDAVGEPLAMHDFLEAARVVTGHQEPFVHLGDEDLLHHGVQYWAGPRSLPLWLPESDAAFMQRSGEAFRAAGGRTRPLVDVLERVLEDERRRGLERDRRAGLTRDEEAAVLDALR